MALFIEYVEYGLCRVQRVRPKEYISLLERTEGLSQPLFAYTDGSYTDGQVVSILQTERIEVGRVLPTDDEGGGGAVRSKSDIYSLVQPYQTYPGGPSYYAKNYFTKNVSRKRSNKD